jgi:tetratricopeptide (TPR) repeat protein
MVVSDPRTRATRLARLRAGRTGEVGPSPPAPARPSVPGAVDRGTRLAADLGGELLAGPTGPVVVVESRSALPASLDGLRALPDPPDISRPFVCLDTETTGLGSAAGHVAFVVGMGAWEGPDFVVRQLVLADHADEPALLGLLAALLPPDACLVTYNGRTFDWPLLVSRFRLAGRPPPPLDRHLDLLPLARQIWKHRLPDARLASVEAAVAGVRRPHDLPSAVIPARYLDYLRSRRGTLLREVLEHNRQDVESLALLMRVLAEQLLPVAADPGRLSASMPQAGAVRPSDLGGLGRVYSRRRRHEDALACFEVALEAMRTPWDPDEYEAVAVERARTLTRLGRRDEAEGAWHAIALEGGRLAALAWVQVAKHREHDGRDPAAALDAARRARALADRARLFGHPDRVVERDLPRRVARLRRQVAGRTTALDAHRISGKVPRMERG